MRYGKEHRFFLRTVASRGVISFNEAEKILRSLGQELSVHNVVKQINEELIPFQQVLKVTNHEVTNEEMIIFLSLAFDDATKSQGIFSATELEYFRILLEQIMTTETRQVTGINAINLVSNMKASFTKIDAQNLLSLWCQMRYLEKDDNNYALGVRAIHEFESYFRQNMPDTVEECCLCKQIVFRGYNCVACGLAVHTRCLNKYLKKVQKWPCCKVDFSQSQLDRLNNESSRLSQNEQLEISEEYNTVVEPVESQNNSEEMESTQTLIPEISQRVTRKRKRQ